MKNNKSLNIFDIISIVVLNLFIILIAVNEYKIYKLKSIVNKFNKTHQNIKIKLGNKIEDKIYSLKTNIYINIKQPDFKELKLKGNFSILMFYNPLIPVVKISNFKFINDKNNLIFKKDKYNTKEYLELRKQLIKNFNTDLYYDIKNKSLEMIIKPLNIKVNFYDPVFKNAYYKINTKKIDLVLIKSPNLFINKYIINKLKIANFNFDLKSKKLNFNIKLINTNLNLNNINLKKINVLVKKDKQFIKTELNNINLKLNTKINKNLLSHKEILKIENLKFNIKSNKLINNKLVNIELNNINNQFIINNFDLNLIKYHAIGLFTLLDSFIKNNTSLKENLNIPKLKINNKNYNNFLKLYIELKLKNENNFKNIRNLGFIANTIKPTINISINKNFVYNYIDKKIINKLIQNKIATTKKTFNININNIQKILILFY